MPTSTGTLALAHHAGQVSTGAQSVSASSLLVQMVVGLVVIIVLIKLATRFVQGRGVRGVVRRPRTDGVAVIGRQSLGKGVQVAMVAAGKQTYLLGVTQRQVTLLGQLDPDEADSDNLDAVGGGLQLLRGDSGSLALASGGDHLPVWKSAIEQMRVRTVRRA